MRLNELKGYRNSEELEDFKYRMNNIPEDFLRYDSFEEFSQYLESKGFKVYGYGIHGIVFKHPGLDYCIKLFDQDPAYLAFVKFCLENKNNPHLPKFRGKFMNLRDGQCAVRTEFLSPLTLAQKQLAKVFELLADESNNWPTPQEVKDVFDENKFSAGLEYMRQNKTLYFTIKEIWNMAPTLRVGLDIHTGNFMNRNGVMVVVDPFSNF